jgi:hypothetical protein
MLIIGVNTGGDLFMFRDYFGDDFQLVGVDLNPECAAFESEDFVKRIFVGSQNDVEFQKSVGREIGSVDIILDDASHTSAYTLKAMKTLWPFLQDDGIYMVEDLTPQKDVSKAMTAFALELPHNCESWDERNEVVPCSTANISVYRVTFVGATVAVWKTAPPGPGATQNEDMRFQCETKNKGIRSNGANGLAPTHEGKSLGNERATPTALARSWVDPSLYSRLDRIANPLEAFSRQHTHGRVLWKGNEYLEAYHANFHALRARGGVRMLIIGVNTGGDLFMFRDYFGEDFQLYGVDVKRKCAAFESEDFVKRIFVGSRTMWSS